MNQKQDGYFIDTSDTIYRTLDVYEKSAVELNINNQSNTKYLMLTLYSLFSFSSFTFD